MSKVLTLIVGVDAFVWSAILAGTGYALVLAVVGGVSLGVFCGLID